MKRAFTLAAILVFGVVCSVFGATTANSTFKLAGLPKFMLSAYNVTAVSVAGADTKNSSDKRAFVQTWTVNGQEVDVLVRIEKARGQIWVDLISAASIGSLTVSAAAFDLTTIAPGHPSPTKDLIDGSAMVSAGGS